MENVIEVENLTHRYGKQIVYEDLSFTVKQGRIFGLLGKNGVGKTTLIKILMGFLRPTSGRCRVLGEESHNLSPTAAPGSRSSLSLNRSPAEQDCGFRRMPSA